MRVTVASTRCRHLGNHSHVYMDTAGGERVTCYWMHQSREAGAAPPAPGAPCWIAWHPADGVLLRG